MSSNYIHLKIQRIYKVQRVVLKIYVKNTKSLKLGISEDEKLTLGNEMIDQVDSFTYVDSIISKLLVRLRVFFHSSKKKYEKIG